MAVQVSYLIIKFGLIRPRLKVEEAYAPTIWVALAAMFAGMYLEQMRRYVALAASRETSESLCLWQVFSSSRTKPRHS